MLNYTLSGLDYIEANVTGNNFRNDTLPLSVLQFFDEKGNTLEILGTQAISLYNVQSNVFKGKFSSNFNQFIVIFEDPHQVKNLIYIHRISSLSQSYSEIVETNSVITNSPAELNITFEQSFKNSSELVVYFTNFLTGNLSAPVTSLYYNQSRSDEIETITVSIPTIESPMIMEVYLEPLLKDRILFDTAIFEYVLYTDIADNFLANTTIIESEEVIYPYIYNLSPLNITYLDNIIEITGENMTDDLQ